MSNTFTETTSTSWFTRIRNSVGGVVIGLILIVGMVVLLFWNEGRAVQTARSLTEGAGAVVSVGADSVDGEPAHVYSYTVTQPVKAESKAWISDRSGLPLQIESRGSFMGVKSTTRVRYSDFDDPAIRIAAPAD